MSEKTKVKKCPPLTAEIVAPPWSAQQMAEPEQRTQEWQQLQMEIERRFGVLPNFFRFAPESPEITANLWGFAQFAYLDNPLPSLFKERLFVYLSRFCEVRYCITRHVGFLIGLGRSAGDSQSPVQTVEQVIRLIRRPFPHTGRLEPYLAQCAACASPLAELPGPDSPMEEAIFACATHAFLQTGDAPKCQDALKHILGDSRFQHLLVFLAFVRTDHYWTKVHPELTIEDDLKQLLATHQTLAEWLLNDPEARTWEISQALMDELAILREGKEGHDELQKTYQALHISEDRLRHTSAELTERVAELQQANAEIQDSRRAALNVMEDAVQARQLVETLNLELRSEITERKQAEEALRESERRFREMIDALPAAIYTTDAEGRLTHFNPAAVEFSGRVPELGTDRWCVSWKLYYPDGRPMPHDGCPMAIALKEGRPVRGVEAIIERPGGKRIWFEPYPTPLHDSAGRIVGGINMLVDITERKQREQVTARLGAIVDSSGDAILSKDLNGIIMSWNKSAERIFGYTAQEAVGQSITMLFPADRLHEESQILEKLRRGEQIGHFETVRKRKDGSTLNISLTLSPIKDAAGHIIGISKIARDITERKQAEVTERLLVEMRERNRLAQELHDTVAQALGYLNLKIGITYSSLISGQVETAKANLQELKQVIGETYTDVREEIFHLRAKALLDLSFMELLDRYIDKYRRFYNLDIQLIQEADPALFEFPAEVTSQFIRTIQEALINIRKHAQAKTAIIRLNQENGQSCIRIEDRGQGFDLNRVKEKTSSFGLQIMRERLESVGGSLEVDTAPGRGTQIILHYQKDIKPLSPSKA